ncbi:MAG: hypothetical protein LBN27_12135 [Prevotellaceae bacterium]|jgi:hypothetical protein|nr:hypothetical protein [Prevotellaceae bacterium]
METNHITINYGLTGVDIRREAMEAIQLLKQKKIDVREANAIKGLLDTQVDVAKTQVEYIKSIPATVREQMKITDVKAIAGTLIDRDAEIEATMAEIEEIRKLPYS